MDKLQSDSVSGVVRSGSTVRLNVSGNQTIGGTVVIGASSKKEVYSNTTEGWNSQVSLVSSRDVIYVYTDFRIVDDHPVPNIKIGDGKAFLIDLPFIAGDSGITPEQIAFWDNKVSVRVDEDDPETVIFYTN